MIKINNTKIKYPKNFTAFSDGAFINNGDINKWIVEGIEHLTKNKDELYYSVSCGRVIIVIFKHKYEEEIYYTIVVSEDYKKTKIKG